MKKQYARKMHPNSLANLELGKFKKGQSGNPKGQPRKEDCLLSCIKEELGKTAINGQTNEQLIAGVLVSMATKGNVKAIELMMSYLHAKPTSSMELSSKQGEPIRIEHDIKPKIESLIARLAAAEQAGTSITNSQ